ncbi:MAG: hypothetical protein E6J90_53535, partial [Deltaproteobacteria bacterium]
MRPDPAQASRDLEGSDLEIWPGRIPAREQLIGRFVGHARSVMDICPSRGFLASEILNSVRRRQIGVRSMAMVRRQAGMLHDGVSEASAALESDTALMRAVIDGSQDALARLYDRHGALVFGAALRTSRDQSIAAEVVQETFLVLWDRAELYDSARGSLPSWLLTIARNRAVDHLRVAGRRDRAAT